MNGWKLIGLSLLLTACASEATPTARLSRAMQTVEAARAAGLPEPIFDAQSGELVVITPEPTAEAIAAQQPTPTPTRDLNNELAYLLQVTRLQRDLDTALRLLQAVSDQLSRDPTLIGDALWRASAQQALNLLYLSIGEAKATQPPAALAWLHQDMGALIAQAEDLASQAQRGLDATAAVEWLRASSRLDLIFEALDAMQQARAEAETEAYVAQGLPPPPTSTPSPTPLPPPPTIPPPPTPTPPPTFTPLPTLTPLPTATPFGYRECSPFSPDWRAHITPAYAFCVAQDLEYVQPQPSVLQVSINQPVALTYKWDVYGVRALYFHVRPSAQFCPVAGSTTLDIAVAGTGEITINTAQFAPGGYNVTLRIIRGDGEQVFHNDKYFCIQ